MEIRIANKLNNHKYVGLSYKGINFLRTEKRIYVSMEDNGRWRGLGRGGYEYAIMEGGKVKLFDSLREIKEYINAYVKCTEAQKTMADLLKHAILA